MDQNLERIERFRLRLLELSNKYPSQRQSIIESSTIVYMNCKPTFNFSKHLQDEKIKGKIQNIFNEVFQ
ncbi:hypothetical protein [Polaribacter atrinae]|uniref:hypothetical protein n=1 Tax=Polaribacter atrinae TaxID=1333662 RepID=UPI000AF4C83C|nr:hypothetical protein [Polaribacter atrinae]